MIIEPSKALQNYLKENKVITTKDIYTISSFMGKNRNKCGVEKNQKLVIRLTTLDRELFGTINALLFRSRVLKTTIQLENIDFQVIDIGVQVQKSQYIHYTQMPIALDGTPNSYSIKLLSPTFFKVGEKYIEELNTRLVFKNLVSKYQKYIGNKIPREVVQEICTQSLEKNMEQHKRIIIDREMISGVQGTYRLNSGKMSIEAQVYVEELLIFATYVGIGHQSAIGYGAVQIIKEFSLSTG